eukprot:maker-scaffold99_size374999-snap-gene-2.32 protein:Tk10064 transcript:maker-scaffold99_size374999-snap-gene-2.32-mRNA-1 annotation:"hypothetical protein LOTGIDRAFT_230532"
MKSFLLFACLLSTALALPSTGGFASYGLKQADSCVDRCVPGTDPAASCQCNSSCTEFGDCCADYEDVCLSCVDRCGIDYFPQNACQCNAQCPEHSNCCDDFGEICGGGDFTTSPSGGNGDLSNAEIKALSERLMAFVITGTMDDFRAQIYTLWLDGYDRDGTSANVVGSSGFEHVFMGELKDGKVSGFHNWLKYYHEEQNGSIDYLGYLSQADFTTNGQGITDVFKWNGNMKCIGSMFVGTPPELDLAVYTTCFLVRGGSKCTMSYNGVEFYVTTFDLKQNGKIHIGTAYPDFT